MLAVYAGTIEINRYMNMYLRLSETAFELEDVLGRQQSVSDTGTNGTSMATLCSFAAPIFGAGTGINLTNLNIKIFDATVPSSGTTTVQWEATSTSTATTVSCAKKTGTLDPLTLPAAMTDTSATGTPGTGAVGHLVVTVTYPYAAILPTKLLNSLHIWNSSTSIAAPIGALNGLTLSSTAYGVPRPPVSLAPGIPYH